MRRGERMKAEKAGRKVRMLLTVDCLAGVDDASRMGALRFTDPDGTTFLACLLVGSALVTWLLKA